MRDIRVASSGRHVVDFARPSATQSSFLGDAQGQFDVEHVVRRNVRGGSRPMRRACAAVVCQLNPRWSVMRKKPLRQKEIR